MKKNGFTLVELLAVIVVLVIILIIAITRIKKVVDNSSDKTIEANAGVTIKAVNNAASNVNVMETSPFQSGLIEYSELKDLGVSISGTTPDDGYVIMGNYEVGAACLTYGEYSIKYSAGEFTKPYKGECTKDFSMTFNYINREEVFEVPFTAEYKLEVWGAQGGTTGRWVTITGGYGGYSVGTIKLNAGDKVYVNVGGAGSTVNGTRITLAGGYNGGGEAYTSSSDRTTASGGGATSIALASGQLKNLSESDRSKVIIVAGGGSGGWTSSDSRWRTSQVGQGGGYIGGIAYGRTNSNSNNLTANGGTQTEGYAFGLGGLPNNTGEHAGAGGGYYGGLVNGYAAGGGSGYIGYSTLRDKVMYCYSCQESNEPSTKTITTSCAQSEPTEGCAKSGNGYARITMMDA